MGMGDVKLALVIGVVLGALGLRYVGVARPVPCCSEGSGASWPLRGRDRKAAIPFGPYMAAGAVVAAFWGARIADWYLRSFTGSLSWNPALEHTFRSRRDRCLTCPVA